MKKIYEKIGNEGGRERSMNGIEEKRESNIRKGRKREKEELQIK